LDYRFCTNKSINNTIIKWNKIINEANYFEIVMKYDHNIIR